MPGVVAASMLKSGEKARVASFAGMEKKEQRKLTSLGLMPGLEFDVLQTFPVFVLRIQHTQLALDTSVVQKIMVEKV